VGGAAGAVPVAGGAGAVGGTAGGGTLEPGGGAALPGAEGSTGKPAVGGVCAHAAALPKSDPVIEIPISRLNIGSWLGGDGASDRLG
jgi:hypothetical protein